MTVTCGANESFVAPRKESMSSGCRGVGRSPTVSDASPSAAADHGSRVQFARGSSFERLPRLLRWGR